MSDYLQQLTIRLSGGLEHVEPDRRMRHERYLLDAQREDGGFAGREGESDPYYTAFGLRALSILGRLYGEPAKKAADFFQGRLHGQETIVDFFSLIYASALLQASAGIDIFADVEADWRKVIAGTLEQLRRDDGGYAKGLEGQASSTYHTFLVVLCLDLLEEEIPKRDEIIKFIRSQQCDEGGFREIRASKRAGTNPTAAAIGTLKILESLDEETIDDTIDFICEMQNDEGGLCANTRIPIADILSTFTGMVTLADLGALHELRQPALAAFIAERERAEGGFQAFALDDNHDVEYTFYGVGTLALFHHPAFQ